VRRPSSPSRLRSRPCELARRRSRSQSAAPCIRAQTVRARFRGLPGLPPWSPASRRPKRLATRPGSAVFGPARRRPRPCRLPGAADAREFFQALHHSLGVSSTTTALPLLAPPGRAGARPRSLGSRTPRKRSTCLSFYYAHHLGSSTRHWGMSLHLQACLAVATHEDHLAWHRDQGVEQSCS
jgi:hypothetical protein